MLGSGDSWPRWRLVLGGRESCSLAACVDAWGVTRVFLLAGMARLVLGDLCWGLVLGWVRVDARLLSGS